MTRWLAWLMLTVGMAGGSLHDVPRSGGERSFARLPLVFEPGPRPRQFLAHCAGFTLFLEGNSATIASRQGVVAKLTLKGARPAASAEGAGRLESVSNYLIGRRSEYARVNVPNYSSVRYTDIYEGIDLVYYSNRRKFEFDFVLLPRADARAIP